MNPTSESADAVTMLKSPIGVLTIAASDRGLTQLRFGKDEARAGVSAAGTSSAARQHLERTRAALKDYFAGRRNHFDDLTVDPQGTRFQMLVWDALRKIPYGKTTSYGELARWIGRPNAPRAVGLANGSNPIGIIIPCHRVIGANGTLVGYGGGIENKRWLLAHESRFAFSLASAEGPTAAAR